MLLGLKITLHRNKAKQFVSHNICICNQSLIDIHHLQMLNKAKQQKNEYTHTNNNKNNNYH